jgi:REP element-mobilizing transposase RayT
VTQTILSAKPVSGKMLLNGHDHHSMSTGRHVRFRGFDAYDEVRIARRRLPHWRQPGVSYFITCRLADSVPQPLLRQWRHECGIWLRLHPQPWSVDEQREYEARFIGRMQEWLDAGLSACHMRRSDVRAEVEGCLLQFDGNRYDIDAFVLMPNHVHAVIKPTSGYDLSTVLQGIKGVSANRCNKLLRYRATFWMDESYDHIVRDAKKLRAFRNYIAQNPKKAGLQP